MPGVMPLGLLPVFFTPGHCPSLFLARTSLGDTAFDTVSLNGADENFTIVVRVEGGRAGGEARRQRMGGDDSGGTKPPRGWGD